MSVHLEGLEFQRREAANKMRSLVSVAETRADGVMLASEQRQFDALSSEIDRLDAAILTAGAERRDDFARRNADATERASGVTDFNRQYGPATGGTGLSGAYVGRESGPYTPDSAANGGNSWVRDMAHARRGNGAAIERLSRNDQHARTYSTRAALSSVTGTGGEFIPPLWLEEQFVKFVRPGRPAWELTSQNALPPGTDSLNIPKINTGTAVALQGFPTGGQNTAVLEQDLTTTSVSSGVVTIAGGQTVSMQLIDQSPLNIDQVVLGDLAAAYAVQADNFLLNGSGTAGQPTGLLNVTGINSIAFTSSAPKFIDPTTSANSFYNRLVNAIQQVTTKRFASPNAILMHPTRWAWIQEAMDTTGRPYILGEDSGPFNAGGIADPGQIAQGRAGHLLGLPVILDATLPVNLGTGLNQDVVIVAKFDDVWTWEGNVRAESFEQTYASNMSLFIRLYNYVSIQGQRYPQSVSVIGGNGLVAPIL